MSDVCLLSSAYACQHLKINCSVSVSGRACGRRRGGDEGQCWKGQKGIGMSLAKQQGQRESPLRRKRKIPMWGIDLIPCGEKFSVHFD